MEKIKFCFEDVYKRQVCTSPAKGTQKTNVKSAEFIEDFGIKEDAHAGKWHRQISLLSLSLIHI